MKRLQITNDSGIGFGTKIIDPETGNDLGKYISRAMINIPADGRVTATIIAFVDFDIAVSGEDVDWIKVTLPTAADTTEP